MRVLFLDFDGPMIPQRAYIYNAAQRDKMNKYGLIYKYFDPCAAQNIKSVLEVTGAELVISSSWRRIGYHDIADVLSINGLSKDYLHKDWATSTEPDATRADRILQWVEEHQDVTSWVAVDDEPLDNEAAYGNVNMKGHFVQVSLEDGILHEHTGRILHTLIRDELSDSELCAYWFRETHNWLWCDNCKELRDKWIQA